MINKSLRIMIVDPLHHQRLRLERDFNRQGYYAIAPVSSLDEMLNLLDYGGLGFDLVLVNASLGANERFDLSTFCLDSPQVGQAVIYATPH